MSYGNAITRTNAEALIPEEVSREIFKAVPAESAIMRLGRRLPNMTRGQQRMPVLGNLVSAGFVNGDTGLKMTSKAEWENKYLNAEEIAVIVPIPEAVLDDADYDIWGEVRPQVVEAFGRVFDAAVLFGTDKPDNWPAAIVPGAPATHVLSRSALAAAGEDLYDMYFGVGRLFSLCEVDGYMPTGIVAGPAHMAQCRGLRTSFGEPIMKIDPQTPTNYLLEGRPITFAMNGAWSDASALSVVGDWRQLVYSIRQDMTYKVLDQAVITDAAGNIIYNLAQQDMVALRCVMRLAWQMPNPVNALNQDDATRYPFAVLKETV